MEYNCRWVDGVADSLQSHSVVGPVWYQLRLLSQCAKWLVPKPVCAGTWLEPRMALSESDSMVDEDDVRRLALALPDVTEIESDGFDFRVANKGFIWSYPERSPGKSRVLRTDIAVLFVGDEAEKQALVLGEPEVFFTTPSYDGWPLVMLRLDAVDVQRLEELVTDAWRMRAAE